MTPALTNEAVLLLLLQRAKADADFRNSQGILRYQRAYDNWRLNAPIYEALKITGFQPPIPEKAWGVSIDSATRVPTVVQLESLVCEPAQEPKPAPPPNDPV